MIDTFINLKISNNSITWHETGRNLQQGDIVLIHDKSDLKGKYVLGMVEEAKISDDGLIRSCLVGVQFQKELQEEELGR